MYIDIYNEEKWRYDNETMIFLNALISLIVPLLC